MAFVLSVTVISAVMSAGVSALNLTCYHCNTTKENDVCYSNVTAAPTQVCNPNISSMTCSVYREDVAGKFTYIVRGCNTSCVQKCGAWGDTVDIDKCSSCCTTPLCNVDDAASSLWTSTTMTMMMLLVLLLWTVVFETDFCSS